MEENDTTCSFNSCSRSSGPISETQFEPRHRDDIGEVSLMFLIATQEYSFDPIGHGQINGIQ